MKKKNPGESVGRKLKFFINEIDPKPKSINSVMYADLINEKAGPALLPVYPDGSAVFQDEVATIHRAAVSLDAVAETFNSGVDCRAQDPKRADARSIENVWNIVKDRVAQNKCT